MINWSCADLFALSWWQIWASLMWLFSKWGKLGIHAVLAHGTGCKEHVLTSSENNQRGIWTKIYSIGIHTHIHVSLYWCCSGFGVSCIPSQKVVHKYCIVLNILLRQLLKCLWLQLPVVNCKNAWYFIILLKYFCQKFVKMWHWTWIESVWHLR